MESGAISAHSRQKYACAKFEILDSYSGKSTSPKMIPVQQISLIKQNVLWKYNSVTVAIRSTERIWAKPSSKKRKSGYESVAQIKISTASSSTPSLHRASLFA